MTRNPSYATRVTEVSTNAVRLPVGLTRSETQVAQAPNQEEDTSKSCHQAKVPRYLQMSEYITKVLVSKFADH